MKLIIRLSNGSRFTVTVETESPTVRDVKAIIATTPPENTPIAQQRLIYKGRILEDSRTLVEYNIVNDSTLFLVKSSSAANSRTTGETIAATEASTSRPASSTFSVAPRASTSHENTFDINDLMARMSEQQQRLPRPTPGATTPSLPDPPNMSQLLNSPLMQGLFDNPALLEQIMQAQMRDNPALQQMMENNPQVREVLQDPAQLRQMAQLMQDPRALQLAQRQQDLALSQLENIPGGFAALSSMYRNVQAPLEESLLAGPPSTEATAIDTPRSAGDEGASGAAMPNPWASRASTTTARTNQSSVPRSLGSAAATAPLLNPWSSSSSSTAIPQLPNIDLVDSPQQRQAALQLLDNPMIQQMMQQHFRENPNLAREMLEAQDPMFRQLFANNPDAANRMMQTLMQPDTMRELMQLHERILGNPSNATASSSLGGGTNPPAAPALDFSSLLLGTGLPQQLFSPATPASSSATTTTTSSGSNALDFGALLQSLQASSDTAGRSRQPPSSSPQQSSADRFRRQLASLYDMGFDNELANLAALEAVHGNVNRAVDYLLSSPVSTNTNTNNNTLSAAVPATTNGETTTTSDAIHSNRDISNSDDTTESLSCDEPSETDTAPKDATEKKND